MQQKLGGWEFIGPADFYFNFGSTAVFLMDRDMFYIGFIQISAFSAFWSCFPNCKLVLLSKVFNGNQCDSLWIPFVVIFLTSKKCFLLDQIIIFLPVNSQMYWGPSAIILGGPSCYLLGEKEIYD